MSSSIAVVVVYSKVCIWYADVYSAYNMFYVSTLLEFEFCFVSAASSIDEKGTYRTQAQPGHCAIWCDDGIAVLIFWNSHVRIWMLAWIVVPQTTTELKGRPGTQKSGLRTSEFACRLLNCRVLNHREDGVDYWGYHPKGTTIFLHDTWLILLHVYLSSRAICLKMEFLAEARRTASTILLAAPLKTWRPPTTSRTDLWKLIWFYQPDRCSQFFMIFPGCALKISVGKMCFQLHIFGDLMTILSC